MTNQTWKVFLACALGAFVGALVALQLNFSFWWVGLFAGFGVGYLAYEFENVVAAIQCQPNPAWCKAHIMRIIQLGSFSLTIWIGVVWILVISVFWRQSTAHGVICAAVMFLSVGFCSGVLVGVMGVARDERSEQIIHRWANPFRVWFWLIPKAMIATIWWLLTNSTRVIFLAVAMFIIIARFSKKTFGVFHSDLRLLCGLDAAFGAIVGLYFHYPLVGAMVGGLWGVLNFEIFSVRVLKFIPHSQSLFRWD
jgi:hypothetical protein